MRHGSLFSGIGGFDLAAEWMGWDNVFHCEWMPFPRKILSHYWPEAISYHDITTTDFRQHLGQIDILTGGFPCQPYSAAGKRKGKDDDRHLWPHMLRCIREVKPHWVVGENVFGLATWNGGLVFEEVCAELEAEGYAVQPFVLPAAAVNAPHRRDRVWFVAHANNARTDERMRSQRTRQTSDGDQRFSQSEHWQNGSDGDAANANLHGLQQRNCDDEEYTGQGRQYAQRDTQQSYGDGDATDAEAIGRQRGNKQGSGITQRQLQDSQTIGNNIRSEHTGCCGEWDAADTTATRLQRPNRCEQALGELTRHGEPYNWQNFPTESPICGGDDGLPARLDGITFPKWRAESIKGYGNAIVPQVALQIFKAIQQYEEL